MFANGELLTNTSASVGRVVLGIAVGTLAGIATGYAASSRSLAGAALRQAVELLRPIPPIAWIPLAILWFGIGSSAAIAVVVVGVFFPFAISCADAISRSRSAVAEVVGLYDIRGRQAVQMEFPAALPEIATALRLAVGLGWTSVIASELVSAQAGLGYLIQESRLLLQMDRVIACMAMIGAIGFALSLVARRVERTLVRRFRIDLA
jgi:NitT/TauT family transport system permease protein/sulfonate transport system permease protein